MMGRSIVSTIILLCAFSAFAENAYTNHAGNVVSGVVVALDARTTTISNAMETMTLPLSIFPESEQRRTEKIYFFPLHCKRKSSIIPTHMNMEVPAVER
jgi:hypothetical protein